MDDIKYLITECAKTIIKFKSTHKTIELMHDRIKNNEQDEKEKNATAKEHNIVLEMLELATKNEKIKTAIIKEIDKLLNQTESQLAVNTQIRNKKDALSVALSLSLLHMYKEYLNGGKIDTEFLNVIKQG